MVLIDVDAELGEKTGVQATFLDQDLCLLLGVAGGCARRSWAGSLAMRNRKKLKISTKMSVPNATPPLLSSNLTGRNPRSRSAHPGSRVASSGASSSGPDSSRRRFMRETATTATRKMPMPISTNGAPE